MQAIPYYTAWLIIFKSWKIEFQIKHMQEHSNIIYYPQINVTVLPPQFLMEELTEYQYLGICPPIRRVSSTSTSGVGFWWQKVTQGILDISLPSNAFICSWGILRCSLARWDLWFLLQVLGLLWDLHSVGHAQKTSQERFRGNILIE